MAWSIEEDCALLYYGSRMISREDLPAHIKIYTGKKCTPQDCNKRIGQLDHNSHVNHREPPCPGGQWYVGRVNKMLKEMLSVARLKVLLSLSAEEVASLDDESDQVINPSIYAPKSRAIPPRMLGGVTSGGASGTPTVLDTHPAAAQGANVAFPQYGGRGGYIATTLGAPTRGNTTLPVTTAASRSVRLPANAPYQPRYDPDPPPERRRVAAPAPQQFLSFDDDASDPEDLFVGQRPPRQPVTKPSITSSAPMPRLPDRTRPTADRPTISAFSNIPSSLYAGRNESASTSISTAPSPATAIPDPRDRGQASQAIRLSTSESRPQFSVSRHRQETTSREIRPRPRETRSPLVSPPPSREDLRPKRVDRPSSSSNSSGQQPAPPSKRPKQPASTKKTSTKTPSTKKPSTEGSSRRAGRDPPPVRESSPPRRRERSRPRERRRSDGRERSDEHERSRPRDQGRGTGSGHSDPYGGAYPFLGWKPGRQR